MILRKNVRPYTNITKYEPLLNKEVFKKNVGPCTEMYQNMIIYETQKFSKKNFKENVRPCTIMYENTIIYEAQKILREKNVNVQ